MEFEALKEMAKEMAAETGGTVESVENGLYCGLVAGRGRDQDLDTTLAELRSAKEKKAEERQLVLDAAVQGLRAVVVPGTTTDWTWLRGLFGDDESLRGFGMRFLELAPEAVAMLARTEKQLHSTLKPLCGAVLNEICFPNLVDLALARQDKRTATRLLEEAMDRLGRNLIKIYDRLKARGYRFRYSRPFFRPADEEVPLVLNVLWRRLGGISLANAGYDSHCDWFLELCGEDDGGPSNGNYSDILEIFAPDDAKTTRHEIELTPDEILKDGYGGGGCEGVTRDTSRLDPFFRYGHTDRLVAYIQNHPKPTSPLLTLQPLPPPTLLNYLRRSVLESAGFPGWLHPTTCPPKLDPLRQHLTADLEVF